MSQVLVLQDDEIERLKLSLVTLEKRITESRTRWLLNIRTLRDDISPLEKQIEYMNDQNAKRLNEVAFEHQKRVRISRDDFSKELCEIRQNSEKCFTKTVETDDTMVRSLLELSEQIRELSKDEHEQSAAEVKTLKRARRLQTRVAELEILVDKMERRNERRASKCEREREKLNSRMTEMKDKCNQSNSSIAATVEEWHESEIEPEGLDQLEMQLSDACNIVERLKRQIHVASTEFEHEKAGLEIEKRKKLDGYREALMSEKRLDGLRNEINGEDRTMDELKERVVTQEDTLNALRRDNLNLVRSVNEADYSVNGRTGSRQRLTELMSE